MIGIKVTRESALAELEKIESELRAEIQGAAKYNALPRESRAYLAWIAAKEKRLATLDCLKAVLVDLPANRILLEDEGAVPDPCGLCKSVPGTRPDPFGGPPICLGCHRDLKRRAAGSPKERGGR